MTSLFDFAPKTFFDLDFIVEYFWSDDRPERFTPMPLPCITHNSTTMKRCRTIGIIRETGVTRLPTPFTGGNAELPRVQPHIMFRIFIEDSLVLLPLGGIVREVCFIWIFPTHLLSPRNQSTKSNIVGITATRHITRITNISPGNFAWNTSANSDISTPPFRNHLFCKNYHTHHRISGLFVRELCSLLNIRNR